MKPRALLLVLGILLVPVLTAGCFRSTDQVVAKESIGYFQFTGQVQGATATVKNDQKTFYDQVALDPNTRYSIRPGNYDVVVTRDGEVVVHRRVFVAEGHAREIEVP